MTTNYFNTKDQYFAFRSAWAEAAQSKQLTAAHMMLFSVICGKDPQHGFTPFQRQSKWEGMGIFNKGAVEAYQELIYLRERRSTWAQEKARQFIEPFGDTFTLEDFDKLTIPKVGGIYAYFGKGMRIAEKLRDGAVAKTVAELLALATEEAA